MNKARIILILCILFTPVISFAQGNPKLKPQKDPKVALFPRPDRSGKFGFVDPSGSFRIKAVFDYVDSFRLVETYTADTLYLARVCYKGKWGYMGRDNVFRLDCVYDSLGLTNSAGRFTVVRDGKYGFASADGRLIVPPVYDDMLMGESVAWGSTGRSWCGIGMDGHIFIRNCSFGRPMQLDKGLFTYTSEDGKLGLMGVDGMAMSLPEFDDVKLSEDKEYILVMKEDRYGCYTLEGDCIMEPLSRQLPGKKLVFKMSTPDKLEWIESPFGSEIRSYDVSEEDNTHTITLALPLAEIKADAFGGNSSLLAIKLPEGILRIGEEAFKGCEQLSEITLPESLLEIRRSAFENCSSLKSLAVPRYVEKLGEYAFYGCNGIVHIDIPEAVEKIEPGLFFECGNLREVTVPERIVSLGDYAFSGCTELQAIDLPFRLRYLGNHSFDKCSSLERIAIPYGDTLIGDGAFKGCVSLKEATIPNSVKRIGEGAFEGCENLASLTLPNSIEEIADWTFTNCFNLVRFVVPNSVTSIGTSAFSGCRNLSDIQIPNSVKQIGAWAFSGCVSLTSVDLPSSLKLIGECAFSKCTGLSSFTIPSSVEQLGADAFLGTARYNKQNSGPVYLDNCLVGFKNAKPAGTVNVAARTRVIADGLFRGCEQLTNITLPEGLHQIGAEMFAGCKRLSGITVPESVREIGDRAFKDCTSLNIINVPKSVTIHDRAFEGCGALARIVISSR